VHKSRLAGLIIDCDTDDLDAAAEFWGSALGAPAKAPADPSQGPYVELAMPVEEPYIEVQKVDHESRVHIDIETDDIAAEVRRLMSLGAVKIADIRSFCVMQSPTGQKFCVVPVVSRDFAEKANCWDDPV